MPMYPPTDTYQIENDENGDDGCSREWVQPKVGATESGCNQRELGGGAREVAWEDPKVQYLAIEKACIYKERWCSGRGARCLTPRSPVRLCTSAHFFTRVKVSIVFKRVLTAPLVSLLTWASSGCTRLSSKRRTRLQPRELKSLNVPVPTGLIWEHIQSQRVRCVGVHPPSCSKTHVHHALLITPGTFGWPRV